MSNLRRYRDRNTGLIESYPESVARTFTFLEEVSEDAKPLAYVPIPADDVANYRDNLVADEPADTDYEPVDEDTEPVDEGAKPEEDKTK